MRGKVPEDRKEHLDTDTGLYNPEGRTILKTDEKVNRIPIRDIFLSVKMIKDVVKSANTVPDILNGICVFMYPFS